MKVGCSKVIAHASSGLSVADGKEGRGRPRIYPSARFSTHPRRALGAFAHGSTLGESVQWRLNRSDASVMPSILHFVVVVVRFL